MEIVGHEEKGHLSKEEGIHVCGVIEY